jgi:hypothetical protein
LLFFCNVFDSPSAPEKTEISAVFQGSDGQIYDGYFVDSAGKEVGIGAALYLPANFDSIRFEVIDSTTKVIDVTVREFMDDYFRDTVWIKHTFMTAGLKNVTITPYATPERLPVTSRIIIEGSVQNAAPQWSIDTLRRTVKVGNLLSQSLPEICADKELDKITFSLVPGAPDNDTIVNSIYQFTPSEQDVGTKVVQIAASDLTGNRSSILPVILTIQSISVEPQPEYDVAYDGNGYTGGIVPADTNKYVTSSTVIVKDNTGFLVKTGLSFAGWNTAADGSGTSYAPGATFLMGSVNVMLYAQWTSSPTYTVTYDGNGNTGGTVPVDANSYQTAASVTVKGNTGLLEKTGATFTGWNTAVDGSGTALAVGATFPVESTNVTLYAQWANVYFTVTYNGNGNTGGEVPSDTNNYETGASVSVKENTGLLVKTGATFTGWNTAADGSGTVRAVGTTFPMGSTPVMLYAQWTSNPTYAVTYDGNGNDGGAVPSDVNRYEAGTPVTVLGNTGLLVKAGSTFAGWNTAADGSGTARSVGTTFPMVSAPVTLYAQWTFDNIQPSLTTQPQDRSVNKGGDASFTAAINTDVYPVPTYIRWVRNNTDTITGATSLSLSLSNVQYSAAGNYKVVVRNSVGTAVSDNATLTVNDVTRPTLTLTGAADTTILLGSAWTDPRGTATDDRDGNITDSITLTGAPANTNTAGRYTITYNVSDAASNAATPVQRTLRIEGWESVTTISKSGFRNAVIDGAENIYIASDQSVYKVSNGSVVEINTYAHAKDLTVALGSDKTNIFTYATVSGLIDRYNGSAWTNLAQNSLNSIQPSSINIGPGNSVYLSGGNPIFMQVVEASFFGAEPYFSNLGEEEQIPLGFGSGNCTSKNFCITTTSDVYSIGEVWSEDCEAIAGKYSKNLFTWTFQTLEVSSDRFAYMKVVNYGSTGYIGYTKGTSNNNPTLYQSGNGSNWTKIAVSVANTPAQGGGGLDIAVSSAGELHAAYVQGSSMLIKKYVNSSWVTIPNCNTTASFTAAGAQNPYVLPGLDFCYIVYSDASNIYIKKWKKQ